MLLIAQGILGVFVFIGLTWALSENAAGVKKRLIFRALSMQVFLAIALTQFPIIRHGFSYLSKGVESLKDATQAGSIFVFGYLGGGLMPFDGKGNTFIFAFQALPMLLVVSALSMLLFYLGVLPWLVKKISWFWKKTLHIGGALGTAAAAKIFLGNIDAPLLIRPYLAHFSRSEMFTVITCGMATTAASVMALYALILKDMIPDTLGHILTASVISIPAAIMFSRILIPETQKLTSGELVLPYKFTNWMDAISKGTSDGLSIFLNIIAMLVVVIALVALGNSVLSLLPHVGGAAITFERIFGLLFAPVTWLMGIPWSEAMVAGKILGTKTVLNEIVAFLELAKVQPGELSPQSSLIMMYALCGFANFSAIGIVIAGMGAMVPERKSEITSLAMKSILTGTLSTCLSGTIIGLLMHLSRIVW